MTSLHLLAVLLLGQADPAAGIEKLRRAVAPECTLAVYAVTPDGREICAIRADDPVRPASTIKILILVEAHARAIDGSFAWDETYALRKEDRVGGGGSLQREPDGTTRTYAQLAGLMMRESDNIATNAFIRRLGMDRINERAAALGLKRTTLGRLMMDEQAKREKRDNWTTARDMGLLWRLLYNRAILTKDACDAIAALAESVGRGGIAKAVSDDVPVGHKGGSLPGLRHDAGWIRLPDRPYLLSVFVSELDPAKDAARGRTLIEGVSGLVHRTVRE